MTKIRFVFATVGILPFLAACGGQDAEKSQVVVNGNNNSGNVVLSGEGNTITVGRDGIAGNNVNVYSDTKGNTVVTNSDANVVMNGVKMTPNNP